MVLVFVLLVLIKISSIAGITHWNFASLAHFLSTYLFLQIFLVISPQAQQPLTVNHKVESASEEETVIQVDIKSENFRAADSNNMGNILAGADELLFSEVKNGSSDTVVDNVVQGEGKNWGEEGIM